MQIDDRRPLSGRVCLVTGGTQGVGAAICRALARAGSDLLVHGLKRDVLANQTLTECCSYGVKVELFIEDLAVQPTGSLALAEKVLESHPQVSLLVNNAGIFIDRPFLDMDWDTYRRTMSVNVDAGYFLTQAIARHWIENQIPGRVLFTSSINGLLAEPCHTAYDTSKAAVGGMVRSLCVTLAPLGIRVNALAPGLVRTPLTCKVLDSNPRIDGWMKLHTPNGEVPEADVCGGAAVFLLSDAAAHVHGQTLYVDGGMSVWQQPDYPENWSQN